AQAITVHGRTRSQGYSGKVDLDIIKKVKESVSIPVIGNGDVKSCYDAKEMLDYTLCDAVMIGRAALGNPWIFKECVDYIEKGIKPKAVSKTEKIEMIKKHVNYLLKIKPEKVVMLEMRSHTAWYLKGLPGGAEVKRKLNGVTTVKELEILLDEYLKESINESENK
ncbi:MAG: tRNA-dihydrouridine synthase, partial [Bacilli bacterium]|nr:tRNA-dihydrouridine synthase [Bacilli bacterium]